MATRRKVALGDVAIVACGMDGAEWKDRLARLKAGEWSDQDMRDAIQAVEGAPCLSGYADSERRERIAARLALTRLMASC